MRDECARCLSDARWLLKWMSAVLLYACLCYLATFGYRL